MMDYQNDWYSPSSVWWCHLQPPTSQLMGSENQKKMNLKNIKTVLIIVLPLLRVKTNSSKKNFCRKPFSHSTLKFENVKTLLQKNSLLILMKNLCKKIKTQKRFCLQAPVIIVKVLKKSSIFSTWNSKKNFTYLVSIKSPDCEKEPKITEFMKKRFWSYHFLFLMLIQAFYSRKNS